MTNDYKDEIINLTKVVRDLTYTIQGACELYVDTNKEQLSSKSIVDINIANKRLADELERTENALSIMELTNKYLNDNIASYDYSIIDLKGKLNKAEDALNEFIRTNVKSPISEEAKPKEKLKLKLPTIGIFKNPTNSIGKALTDKDFADISAPLDLHGLHLNDDIPLENDLIAAKKDNLDKPFIYEPNSNCNCQSRIYHIYTDKTFIDDVSELSKYSRRYLRKANIKTIDDLLNINEQGLDNVKYLGVATKREIKELINSDSIGCYYLNKRR